MLHSQAHKPSAVSTVRDSLVKEGLVLNITQVKTNTRIKMTIVYVGTKCQIDGEVKTVAPLGIWGVLIRFPFSFYSVRKL